MRHKTALISVLLMGLVTAPGAEAEAPHLINYQGILTDAQGEPIEGIRDLTFKIYPDSQQTTPPLWTELHSGVQVAAGLFNVILGGNTPISDSLFEDTERWMGITVGSDPEISPRMRLTSVPWALRAAVADSALTGGGSVDGHSLDAADGDPVDVVYVNDGGNVGIGTSTPDGKLAIHGDSLETTNLVLSANYPESWRWRIKTIDRGQGIDLDFTVSDLDDEESTILTLTRGGASGRPSLAVGDDLAVKNGCVGIDTDDPRAKLDVRGAAESGGTWVAARLGNAFNHWTYFGDGNSGRIRGSGEGYLYLSSNPAGTGDKDIYFDASGGHFRFMNGSITVRGNILLEDASGLPVVELGEGLDYAEGFDVSDSEEIDPGSVVIIDSQNPGKVTLSRYPYDSRVAGIVAGARNLGSGVRLGGDRFGHDVALAGRVYCNVDATEAAVEPGDLLTTSSTPGYGMKAVDQSRTQGAILGKAMQRLEKGQRGQILVLVTLQ